MDSTSLWTVFGSDVTGTAVLILLGVGVVANVSLPKSSGNGGGWIVLGWGLGVLAGVCAAASTGAQLNATRARASLTPSCRSAGTGDSNRGYAWLPVVGPLAGAMVAGA